MKVRGISMGRITAAAVLCIGLAAADQIKRTYQWEDINSAKVLERGEDKIVIDGKSPLRKFRLDLAIPSGQLNVVVNSFGIPFSRLRFRYTDQEDLNRKQAELVALGAAHGIAFSKREKAFGPDYAWIVVHSRTDMSDVTNKLNMAAKSAGYVDGRTALGLYSSFVQSIPYKEQAPTRKASDGSAIFVAGVTMPLETLVNNSGDCDTKCLLFASLLSSARGPEVVLLRGGGHVFAGVRTIPKPKDRFIRVRNDTFVLIELTSPWLIGHIPGESWRGLQAKKFEVISLPGN